MNLIKKNILRGAAVMMIIISASSCQKASLNAPDQTVNTQSLKVSPSFDWKTSREIMMSITGMKEISPDVSNTLYIKSSKGDVIFKDYFQMNSDYTFKFVVPSTETSVTLVYGKKTYTAALTSSVLSFNYVTVQ
ncbi:MAG: hypothetical protein WCI48_08690 [Bacteroidota bacterium]